MRRCARIVVLMLVGALLAPSAPVRAQVCGDGVIDAGETCDPPNPQPDPVTGQPQCRSDCTFCGDGIVDADGYESCDAGPYAMCGACNSNCTWRLFNGEGYGGCHCAFANPALVNLRADILAACQCGDASSHGAFVRCARAELLRASASLIIPPCRNTVLKCLARSVCGRRGAVTCCRTNANGLKRCAIKPDAAHCTAPSGGSASLGVTEDCCDACP